MTDNPTGQAAPDEGAVSPRLVDVVAESVRHTLAIHPWGVDLPYPFCEYVERMKAEVAELALTALREVCTIRTVEQLDALPPESIVKTSDRSIACRHYDRVHGVVFGDERPFEWSAKYLALPALLLWHPDWEA